MRNRDLDVGSDFMERSLYNIASLQQGVQPGDKKEPIPPPFKIYQNIEHYKLHQTPPLTLGDARWSFSEYRLAHSPALAAPRRDRLDFESLSTLLYYSYGFSRHDEGAGVSWPFHRFVPSARCFFPAELYLWLPEIEHIPAGLYHYDNLHHSLAQLRQGQYRDLFARATDTDLGGCLGILLVSALFWKNAFKYINFSYRLCTQEAGIVTSNALMVAGALGFSGRVHYQFLDQSLNQLLGFQPYEESLLTIVPLYAASIQGEQRPRRLYFTTTEQSLSQTVAPLTADYIQTTTFDYQLCSLLTKIDQHSFLEDTIEIVTEDTVPPTICLTSEERVARLEPCSGNIDLAQVLHSRSSGDVDFSPLCVPLAQEAFWEIIRYGLAAYNSDLQCTAAPPRLQLYLVIQHVAGIQAGIYRLCTICNMLHVIERGDMSMQIQAIQTQGNITSASAHMICYLVGDYAATSNLFGNRAYRILHLEAGLIAQRLCLMSAAQGAVARYSNSYIAAPCKALLKLSSTLEPMAELVIGYEQRGAQAGNRYRFSLLR